MSSSISSAGGPKGYSKTMVIAGSTLGTLFEFYDFFLFGAMAAVFSKQFFGSLQGSTAYLFALIAFGVGFAVRPIGALIFGRLGDRIGRKRTFMLTMVLMGGATFAVGLLPTYGQIGIWAPILLMALRVIQGLGLGGEYGGAAIYVAEHSHPSRRGRDTSWIQMTGAGGTILSLAAVYACKAISGNEFDEWGWRLPFLLSGIMLVISLYIRTKLGESPVFQEMKERGKTSKAPLRETFGSWTTIKAMAVAMLGLVAGSTTVLYTAQTYVVFFLNRTLHVDIGTSGLLVCAALVVAMPMVYIAGAVSDHIGRKKVILTGCLLAAVTFFPIYKGITHYANPALEAAVATAPVVVLAPEGSCAFRIDVLGSAKAQSDCDRVKEALAKGGVPYTSQLSAQMRSVEIQVGTETVIGADVKRLETVLKQAGYPAHADEAQMNKTMIVVLIVLMCSYFAMVYAPLAAALVEMFPAKVRYTAMSFPYHVGNGIIGGFFPATAFAMVTATGDIYFGIWYPVFFAIVSVVIGGLFLRDNAGSEQTQASPEKKDSTVLAGIVP